MAASTDAPVMPPVERLLALERINKEGLDK